MTLSKAVSLWREDFSRVADWADGLRAAGVKLSPIFGVYPDPENVCQDLLEAADLLLPVGTFAESSGTFVNAAGTWQSFPGVANPVGEARPTWKILRVLGNLIDAELPPSWAEGGDPAEIVEARGMKQVTDTGAIEAEVDKIIAAIKSMGFVSRNDDTEIIEPGYHKLFLDRYQTQVEYTSTDRVAFYRLTYRKAARANPPHWVQRVREVRQHLVGCVQDHACVAKGHLVLPSPQSQGIPFHFNGQRRPGECRGGCFVR